MVLKLSAVVAIVVLTGANARSVPAEETERVPVFLEPNRPVSTGTKTKTELNHNIHKIISKKWEFIESNNIRGWTRASLLLSPWHFESQALLTASAPTYRAPQWDLSPQATASSESLVEILEISEDWAKVSSSNSKEIANSWVKLADLKPLTNQWGRLFITFKQNLKSEPSVHSTSLSILTPGMSFVIQKVQNGFAKVELGTLSGYVRLSETMSKLQLAQQVQDPNGNWYNVDFVMGDWIQIKDKKFLPLADIRAIRINTERLYVASSVASLRSEPSVTSIRKNTLSRWQPVRHLESMTVRWAQFKLPTQQSLWWAINGPDSKLKAAPTRPPTYSSQSQRIKAPIAIITSRNPKTTISSKNIITTTSAPPVTTPLTLSSEALFRRKVFDIAASPVIPNLMFASANGIFRSLDGKKWEQLSEFEEHNYPIAVAPDGTVYVGPFRSTDHGLKFSSFVRWDHLVEAIQRVTHTTSTELRLTKIEIPANQHNTLKLTLHTGSTEVQVVSKNAGLTWDAAN